MNTKHIFAGMGVGLTLIGVGLSARYLHAEEKGGKERRIAHGGASRTPVLVELFTSEGCSSCPSADKLMASLAASQPVEGVEIIALEEHVDYWNRIGWTDPFSSAKFTRRQYDYGSHFHLESVYTPQAVVDGSKEFVGSDKGTALAAIQEASQTRKADVRLKIASDDGKQLKVEVAIDGQSSGTGRGEILLALAEDDLKVHVGSGENSGRNLVHYGVVRHFASLGTTAGSKPFTAQATIPLNPTWKRDHLRLVAFVQSADSKHIVGIGTMKLPASTKG